MTGNQGAETFLSEGKFVCESRKKKIMVYVNADGSRARKVKDFIAIKKGRTQSERPLKQRYFI